MLLAWPRGHSRTLGFSPRAVSTCREGAGWRRGRGGAAGPGCRSGTPCVQTGLRSLCFHAVRGRGRHRGCLEWGDGSTTERNQARWWSGITAYVCSVLLKASSCSAGWVRLERRTFWVAVCWVLGGWLRVHGDLVRRMLQPQRSGVVRSNRRGLVWCGTSSHRERLRSSGVGFSVVVLVVVVVVQIRADFNRRKSRG